MIYAPYFTVMQRREEETAFGRSNPVQTNKARSGGYFLLSADGGSRTHRIRILSAARMPVPSHQLVRLPFRLSHLHAFSTAIVILRGVNRNAHIIRERPGNWCGWWESNHHTTQLIQPHDVLQDTAGIASRLFLSLFDGFSLYK